MAIYGELDLAVLMISASSAFRLAGGRLPLHPPAEDAGPAELREPGGEACGVFTVRLSPSVFIVLPINAIMSLPTVLAELTGPRIFGAVSASKELIRGAPFQTLS
jgi:hypothetical protein